MAEKGSVLTVISHTDSLQYVKAQEGQEAIENVVTDPLRTMNFHSRFHRNPRGDVPLST